MPTRRILRFVTAEPRRTLKSLEDSPDYFWERFSAYAARLVVGPEPLGSPLLELITPFGPLYTFDRGLSPLSGGAAEVLLHGQVEEWKPGEAESRVQSLGGGRYELSGQVDELLGTDFFVLKLHDETAVLKLVLFTPTLPSRGDWVTARLLPPLMSFRSV